MLVSPQSIKEMKKAAEKFMDFDQMADEGDSTQTIGSRATISWSNKLNWARNQGSCGSCWAFSTAGAIEAALTIKNGKATPYLSVQQILDCVNNGQWGCNGGYPASVFDYVKGTGLVADTSYSYNDKTGTCNTATISKNAQNKIKSYNLCSGSTCTIDAWYANLQIGPSVVMMDASSLLFQLYLLGTIEFSASDCKTENHAIYATGWSSEWYWFQTMEYATVRNSWGLLWGETGNFNVKYDTTVNNTCFITSWNAVPLV